jgi:hypothetical protein
VMLVECKSRSFFALIYFFISPAVVLLLGIVASHTSAVSLCSTEILRLKSATQRC